MNYILKLFGNKFSLKHIFTLVIIFSVIFVSNEMFLFDAISFAFMSKIRAYIQLLTFFLLIYIHKDKIKKPINHFVLYILMLLFFSSSIVLSLLFNWDYEKGGIYGFYQIFIIIFTGLIVLTINIDYFFKIYYKIMVFVALFSLFIYSINLLSPSILSFLPIFSNSVGHKFRCAIFSMVPLGSIYLDFRNFGPCREPGVYQMLLNLSLLFGLFRYKKTKIWEIIVIIMAILSTLSTTAYFSMFCFIAAFLLKRDCVNNIQNLKKIVLICITIFVLFILPTLQINEKTYVIGKLIKGKESNSTVARLSSIVSNIIIFSDFPLFGAGVKYTRDYFSIYTKEIFKVDNHNNTNTFFKFLAHYGYLFFLLYLIRLFIFIYKYYHAKLLSIFLFVGFLALLSGENISFSILFWLPVLYESKLNYRGYRNTQFMIL